MIKRIEVEISSKTPILMHRFPLEPIEAIEKKTPEEQAQLFLYKDRDVKNGQIYVPGVNIQRAFISAAVYSKGKGRASLQKIAAACLFVTPEKIYLENQEYKIDSRPVVMPATKGRIIRHRPRFDDWKFDFYIEYDSELLTESQVRKIVDDACDRVGFLDFRPEKKGPYGRGYVTKWTIS